ncbi:polyketide synthase, putative [Paecilomyces variotii No. 5]|uniref:Polyketide synthase, putative n=1 Tax=Byssochlamys spectabilis (strain No. 5 / NBRC 109023) TaxID=1356009 RepID=V5G236_BYSSN|nr:polyketide synthase, putative [Paecilomyces variotii No. 5]
MSQTIVLFGDTSISVQPALSLLLSSSSQKELPLLRQFLERSCEVLRDEVVRLRRQDREGLPSFASDLYELCRNDKKPENPILSPVMLVIVQLGQFIAWYEKRAGEKYPDTSSTIIIGLCIGQLSATAVSLTKSLVELIPFAVEAVRIAFRVGVVVTNVKKELEPGHEGQTWAMSRDKNAVDDEVLKRIQEDLVSTVDTKVYISGEFPKTITLQGPPSTLLAAERWFLAQSGSLSRTPRHRVPIYAPYHAPHLYTEEEIQRLIVGLPSLREAYYTAAWCEQQPRLISPAKGSPCVLSSRRDAVEQALRSILLEPIRWDAIVEGCRDCVHTSQHENWIVRPFGPTHSAKSLVRALELSNVSEIVLDESAADASPSQPAKVPIAIVGMAGRFPDADDVDELWQLLIDGKDCHRLIPKDRFDPEIYVSQDKNAKNKSGTPYGNFLRHPGLFDARFFNMSPREAAQTDPQQRLALVTAYEALEMAGYVPNRTPSTQLDRIGSFYGQTTDDYKDVNVVQDIDTYYVSGVIRAFGPGRVSRHNQLGGPSLSVDTACSSSAMALNIACSSVWSGECDTAVVGGMLLLNSPDMYAGLTQGHFTSTTGPCKTFDNDADGYCRGETIASVVIKRLDAAQADNDRILGVISAAGTNYSAYAASITQPHGPTQEMLYNKVLRQAGISPFEVDYVEMHGTGTQLGDAIEMSSVSNVFAPTSPIRPADQPLYVGSVKANIGHGESASGIAALIKMLLIFREQRLPPHVGIKSGILNRTFPDLKERNIRIPMEVTEFPCQEHLPARRRRGMINNFGAAGGNSAFILEEAPSKEDCEQDDARPYHVVSVTAKSKLSLERNIQNLITYLERHQDVSLSDLAYTTTARRIQHPLRVSAVGSTIVQVKDYLSSVLTQVPTSPGKYSNIAFVFTGQGSLYQSVGKELFQLSLTFQSDLLRFDQIVRDHGFPSFLPAITGTAEDFDHLSPVQSQLALTALQMALSRLWVSWRIIPSVVIGHSLGEYAALYAAEVLSASDTLYLVGQRARILEETCTPGTHSMLAIHETIQNTREILGDGLDNLELSCVNGPNDIVLSGEVSFVQQAEQLLKSRGIKCTILEIAFAFHSPQVEPILDPFVKAAQSVNFSAPRVPIISTALGSVVRDSDSVNAHYLQTHTREPVQFVQALRKSRTEGLVDDATVWLELGPNPICLSMVTATFGSDTRGNSPIRGMPTLRRRENPWKTISNTLSFLHTYGVDIDWSGYHQDFERGQKLLHLPAYSFDERNYWIEYKNNWLLRRTEIESRPSPAASFSTLTTTVQRLLFEEVADSKVTLLFEDDLSEPALNALIAGHSLNGVALCPSGVFADIALTVGDYIRRKHRIHVPSSGLRIMDMEIMKPVTVSIPRSEVPQPLSIHAIADLQTGYVNIEIGENKNARCRVEFGDAAQWLDHWSRTAYLVQERMVALEHSVSSSKIFHRMAYDLFSTIVDYDQWYRGMQEVVVDTTKLEATATLKLYEGRDAGVFFCSPLWLDNLAQLAGFVLNATGVIDPKQSVYISHGLESYQLGQEIDPRQPYRVHVRMLPVNRTVVAGDVSIFQGDTMVGKCGGVKFQKVPRSLLTMLLRPPTAASPEGTAPSPTVTAPAPSRKTDQFSAPKLQKSSISIKILNTLAEQIGLSADELTNESSFEELGVDSLLSLTIHSVLRESLQLNLPVTLFQDFQTVGELKNYLIQKATGSDGDDDNDDSDNGPSTPDSTPPFSAPATPAPMNEKESVLVRVHAVVAEEMGIAVEELLTTDDWSALGLDSLMALSISGALNERLGVSLPPDILGGHVSRREVEKALNLSPISPPETAKERLVPSPAAPPGNKAGLARLPSSVVLQGNSNAASQTVFFFPEGSGAATAYADLPSIAPGLCVIALNSPFLKEAHRYTDTIEHTAAIMVREVKHRQPQGPYVLAGWSAGGMYAFEAARQLTQAGESVAKLILIDSPCRLEYDAMPREVLEIATRSGAVGGIRDNQQWVVEHFEATIRAVQKYAPVPLVSEDSPRTVLVWATDGLMANLDGDRDIDSSKLDFDNKTTEWLMKPRAVAQDDTQGWKNLIPRDRITVARVPGNHFSMMRRPNAVEVSRVIAKNV